MPVSSPHPAYQRSAPLWERMRDAAVGEDAVKAKGSVYLPVPPTIEAIKDENSGIYRNYLARARFPEAVGPAVEGMAGLMAGDGGEITLPDRLGYLRKAATPDGLGLDGLLRRVRHEVVALGRHVLLVDAPPDGGDPFIATYSAESLINWRADGGRATLAVFHEIVNEPDPADPFVAVPVSQWREAAVDTGEDGAERYVVRLWRHPPGSESPIVISEVVPTRQGQPLDFVPVVAIGSRDLALDPDAVPLLGVANKALHFFRQYADYALQLFMSANGTTPYLFGGDEAPEAMGPGAFWKSSGPDTKAGYLEISANGLDAQRQSLDAISQEIADAAMRALGDGRKGTESGEALRLRFHSQTATLASIARSTSAGIERALGFVAQWIGVDGSDIAVAPDLDFIHEAPSPQVLATLQNGVERGILPDTLLWNYVQRVRLTQMSVEELRGESPAVQAIPQDDDLA